MLDRDGTLVGILSSKDIKFARDLAVPVTRFMTHDVITAPPGTTLQQAYDIMQKNKVGKLPLVAGRTLTDRDLADAEPVAVINESLAEECWPGQQALGKRVLRLRRAGPLAMTVVGVVADAREIRVGFRKAHAAWYLPYRQHQILRDLNVVVRGDVAPTEAPDTGRPRHRT